MAVPCAPPPAEQRQDLHLDSGRPAGPPEGQVGGQTTQRPFLQPIEHTYNSQHRWMQCHAGLGHRGGWHDAALTPGAQQLPLPEGLVEKRRLHTCAKCIWSRSTRGLSFPLRAKQNTPITAFQNWKKKETENTSLSLRIKKGMKHWFIQSTVACSLKIILFIKKRKIKKSLNTLSSGELGFTCQK